MSGCSEAFDEFFEEVFGVFERPDSWRLFPETREVLTMLKDQGFELGIISNFDSRLFSVLRGLGIAQLFDTVTYLELWRMLPNRPSVSFSRPWTSTRSIRQRHSMSAIVSGMT